MRDFKELYPDETEQLAIVYGELPSMATVAAQFNAAAEKEGVAVVDEISYPIIGADDWGPYADLVIDSGATSVYWIGEPSNAANLSQKLHEKGWEGVILHQTNAYDAVLFSFGDEGVEGSVLRTAFHPFEEADQWPAIQQYNDMLDEIPDAKTAALGLQAMSAWLLFSIAANTCATKQRRRDQPHLRARGVRGRRRTGPPAACTSRPSPGGDPPQCDMLVDRRRTASSSASCPSSTARTTTATASAAPRTRIAEVDISDLGEGAVDPDRPEL